MRAMYWLVTTAGLLCLTILFSGSLLFKVATGVSAVKLTLESMAEFRERRRYAELDSLDFEARRQLPDSAGEQGLVKRPPPDQAACAGPPADRTRRRCRAEHET